MSRLLKQIDTYSIETIVETRGVEGGILHNCVLTNGIMLYAMETFDKFVFSYEVVKNDLFDQYLVNPHKTIMKSDLHDKIWDKLEYNKSQFTKEQLDNIYWKMDSGDYDIEAMKLLINPNHSVDRMRGIPCRINDGSTEIVHWIADVNKSDRLVNEVTQCIFSGASEKRILSWDYSKYSDDDGIIIARSIKGILTDEQIHMLLEMNISFKEKNKLRIQWAKQGRALRKQAKQQRTTE